mmetsp:Transcript_8675/g.28513  ORF Transcript_8675/g.28513 Transcript_8675/m.28513 type:complete len:336 (-) Transcript_8675:101-1108(-)
MGCGVWAVGRGVSGAGCRAPLRTGFGPPFDLEDVALRGRHIRAQHDVPVGLESQGPHSPPAVPLDVHLHHTVSPLLPLDSRELLHGDVLQLPVHRPRAPRALRDVCEAAHVVESELAGGTGGGEELRWVHPAAPADLLDQHRAVSEVPHPPSRQPRTFHRDLRLPRAPRPLPCRERTGRPGSAAARESRPPTRPRPRSRLAEGGRAAGGRGSWRCGAPGWGRGIGARAPFSALIAIPGPGDGGDSAQRARHAGESPVPRHRPPLNSARPKHEGGGIVRRMGRDWAHYRPRRRRQAPTEYPQHCLLEELRGFEMYEGEQGGGDHHCVHGAELVPES